MGKRYVEMLSTGCGQATLGAALARKSWTPPAPAGNAWETNPWAKEDRIADAFAVAMRVAEAQVKGPTPKTPEVDLSTGCGQLVTKQVMPWGFSPRERRYCQNVPITKMVKQQHNRMVRHEQNQAVRAMLRQVEIDDQLPVTPAPWFT